MDYAITLYMNDEKTAMVKGLINEIAPICGSDYCLQIVPHITIAALVADDEDAVLAAAEKLSKQLKKGEVKIGAVGAFVPFVLYLSPVVDSYLTGSCRTANETMLKVAEVGNKGRYTPDHWVPHMAVAQKMDREGLCRGFDALTALFSPFAGEIDRMALIKWEPDHPYQELAVYDLQ